MRPPIPVWVASLGCAKNRVDTERLLGSLGVPVKLVDKPGLSRLLFINTCAFIESATRESLRTIFDVGKKLRRLRRKPLVVVAGCLPGRYGIDELAKEIPEVDLWLDTRDQSTWAAQIIQVLKLESKGTSQRLFTQKSYAFLKIAEGCPRHCTYCAIPSIKGKLKSESSASLYAEGKAAVEKGAKELILVAQDTTAWGMDFSGLAEPWKLPGLVRALAEIPGLQWLRLLYLYPPLVTAELLKELKEIGRPFIPYFDIPLQHSESAILKAMHRPAKDSPLHLVQLIRNIFPDAALRTTLMVGFPGETEEMFNNMLKFVSEARFQHLGVFKFQPEEGTGAALLPDQIPDSLKEERYNLLMDMQKSISHEYLLQFRDENIDVLIDNDCFDQWPGLYKGHTWFQCPETDGETYVSGGDCIIGEFYKCEVIDTGDYDISAVIDDDSFLE